MRHYCMIENLIRKYTNKEILKREVCFTSLFNLTILNNSSTKIIIFLKL